jgi:hypothetical protein
MITELFKTQRAKIAELVPHVANPRKIKQEEKRKLWLRLQRFGMIGIPVQDADGTLLSGHQRCELYAQYGFGEHEIDVRVAKRKLTEDELREIMVIENTHAGEFDLKKLQAEFDQYINLDDFGFDFEALNQQLSESLGDVIEDEPEYPIVPKFSESYSAVVIVIENSIDENFVRSVLGLEKMKDYKTDNIAESYVITAKQFSERWNSK